MPHFLRGEVSRLVVSYTLQEGLVDTTDTLLKESTDIPKEMKELEGNELAEACLVNDRTLTDVLREYTGLCNEVKQLAQEEFTWAEYQTVKFEPPVKLLRNLINQISSKAPKKEPVKLEESIPVQISAPENTNNSARKGRRSERRKKGKTPLQKSERPVKVMRTNRTRDLYVRSYGTKPKSMILSQAILNSSINRDTGKKSVTEVNGQSLKLKPVRINVSNTFNLKPKNAPSLKAKNTGPGPVKDPHFTSRSKKVEIEPSKSTKPGPVKDPHNTSRSKKVEIESSKSTKQRSIHYCKSCLVKFWSVYTFHHHKCLYSGPEFTCRICHKCFAGENRNKRRSDHYCHDSKCSKAIKLLHLEWLKKTPPKMNDETKPKASTQTKTKTHSAAKRIQGFNKLGLTEKAKNSLPKEQRLKASTKSSPKKIAVKSETKLKAIKTTKTSTQDRALKTLTQPCEPLRTLSRRLFRGNSELVKSPATKTRFPIHCNTCEENYRSLPGYYHHKCVNNGGEEDYCRFCSKSFKGTRTSGARADHFKAKANKVCYDALLELHKNHESSGLGNKRILDPVDMKHCSPKRQKTEEPSIYQDPYVYGVDPLEEGVDPLEETVNPLNADIKPETYLLDPPGDSGGTFSFSVQSSSSQQFQKNLSKVESIGSNVVAVKTSESAVASSQSARVSLKTFGASSDIAYVKPEVADTDQEAAWPVAADTDQEASWPVAADVNPEAAFIKPETAFVKPEAALASSASTRVFGGETIACCMCDKQFRTNMALKKHCQKRHPEALLFTLF